MEFTSNPYDDETMTISLPHPKRTADADEVTAVEPQKLNAKLNWLRAAVLGANDGIISIAGLVMGVAGAQVNSRALLIAGLAGVVSGALSMAGGEYVSVSSQRDTERAALREQQALLDSDPDGQLDALTRCYRERGISEEVARQVAKDLTAHNALSAHAETRLGIDSEEYTSATAAAFSSFVSFALGAVIPLLLMVLTPSITVNLGIVSVSARVIATMIGVIMALLLTGYASATLGGGPKWKPMIRNVVVGVIGMVATYGIGSLFQI